MCGDVRFRRTVLVDGAGLTRYPLDEELDLPGRRPREPVGALVPGHLRGRRAVRPHGRADGHRGGSPVSATTVMDSVRSAGEAIAGIERARARDLFRDGVAPRADSAAEEVLVEADGTWVRMRDGSMAEVKAVVAYAGKEEGRGVEPVRLGCVGERRRLPGANRGAGGLALRPGARRARAPRDRRRGAVRQRRRLHAVRPTSPASSTRSTSSGRWAAARRRPTGRGWSRS